MSAQPTTLMSGYSALYSTVYSIQESVHYTVQSSIGMWGVRVISGMQLTALHQGLSKNLTAQDTHITPTLTKHKQTLARLGKLLFLQQRSTIQKNGPFLSLVLSKLFTKLDIALI